VYLTIRRIVRWPRVIARVARQLPALWRESKTPENRARTMAGLKAELKAHSEARRRDYPTQKQETR